MKHCSGILKRALCLLFAIAMIGMTVTDSASASSTQSTTASSSLTYALNLSTGTSSGNSVGMFIVNYTGTDGQSHAQYIMAKDGAYQETLAKAASADNLSIATKNASLSLLGYTATDYSQAKPLQSNSTCTYLVDFDYEVEKVNSIDIVTDINSMDDPTQSKEWDCNGMEFYKVDSVDGLDYNGYYSTSYEVLFTGTLLASAGFKSGKTSYQMKPTTNSDTIVRCAPTTASYYDGNFYLIQYSGQTSSQRSYRDVYVEIDLADVYGAGIEAYTNMANSSGSPSKLSELYLPEVLDLRINYRTATGSGRTVVVPVMTSALAFAMQNSSAVNALTSETTLADYMGQGETVMLKLRLYDYASLNTSGTSLSLIYDTSTAEASAGLVETNAAASSHKTIREKINSDQDSFSFTGIYFYDADGLLDADVRENVQDGTILTYSMEKSPTYYYSAGTVSGDPVLPTIKGKGTSYTLGTASGSNLRPKSTKTNYIVVMRTTNSDLAASTSRLQLKLGYTTSDNGQELYTENYEVQDLVKDYYGYWPATGGGDASYMISMIKGEEIYCLVQLSGVSKFTSATLTLEDNDPWQCEDFYIYQVGDDAMAARHILWKKQSNGTVSTDRLIYRPFNANDAKNSSTTVVDDTSTSETQAASEQTSSSESSTTEKSDLVDYGDGSSSSSSGKSASQGTNRGVDISGLGGVTLLQSLESIEVYLDAAHPVKKIEFESKETKEDSNDTDWRDDGRISAMDYNDTQEDLGFTTRQKTYTIDVEVGKEDYASEVNGDPGSSNYFYFQLEFKNGTSGFVQANQQLASDGFVSGETARFTVTTNHDYGELVAVNVIPDDSTTSASPYDKLKIDSIKVTTTQEDNTYLEWVCNTTEENAWVGIDYVEEGSETSSFDTTSRDLSDIMTTYQISQRSEATAVLVGIETGSYGDSYQLQAKQLYAYFNVTKLDGSTETISCDVISYMYNFTGEDPLENPDPIDPNKKDKYLTNTDTMLHSGQINYFIMTMTDVRSIDSVDLVVQSNSEDQTYWCVNNVTLDRITADNGRKIDAVSNTYVLDGSTQRIATADKSELGTAAGWSESLSPDTKKTYHIPFTKQTEIVADSTTEAYEINNIPDSHNDYLNVSIYMKNDGTDYSSCSITSYVTYHNIYETYYRTSPSLKRKTENGQTVFYANGVGAKYISSIQSIYLMAEFNGVDQSAVVDHIIIQWIKDGVVAQCYYYLGGGADITYGLSFSQTAPNPDTVNDYQVVTLMFGSDMLESQLTAKTSDVAVAIRYTMTSGNQDKVYQSPYIYLTDQNITSIGPNRMVKLTFNQEYVNEIKGITVAVTGTDLYAYIDTATIGVYEETGTTSADTASTSESSNTESTGTSTTTLSATDVKSGYTCAGWFSVVAQQKIMAGSATFSTSCSQPAVKDALVPLRIKFITKSGTDSNQDYGLSNGATADVTFLYTGFDGNAYTRTVTVTDFVEDRSKTNAFASGSEDVVAFMEQNMENITAVIINPHDDADGWTIDKMILAYGDGAEVKYKEINVGQTAYEDAKNDSKYPGLFVGLQKVTVNVKIDSVCGAAVNKTFSTMDASSEDHAVRISQLDGSVRFTVSATDTDLGVKVMAGRDSSTDASNYLSQVAGTTATLEFKPPTANLTTEVKYKIRVYAVENPERYVEFYVYVDANLHDYSCAISTSDIRGGEKAQFTFTLSDPLTENSYLYYDIDGSEGSAYMQSGMSSVTIYKETSKNFSGQIVATLKYIKGCNSSTITTPKSSPATCNVEKVTSGTITVAPVAGTYCEGDTVKFTLTLTSDTAAIMDIVVPVTFSHNDFSTSTAVTIPAGSTTATAEYANASQGTWSATLGTPTGGGYDTLSASGTASITVNYATEVNMLIATESPEGTEDTLTLTLSSAMSEDVYVTIQSTVYDYPGAIQYNEICTLTYIIPAGKTSLTINIDSSVNNDYGSSGGYADIVLTQATLGRSSNYLTIGSHNWGFITWP